MILPISFQKRKQLAIDEMTDIFTDLKINISKFGGPNNYIDEKNDEWFEWKFQKKEEVLLLRIKVSKYRFIPLKNYILGDDHLWAETFIQ